MSARSYFHIFESAVAQDEHRQRALREELDEVGERYSKLARECGAARAAVAALRSQRRGSGYVHCP